MRVPLLEAGVAAAASVLLLTACGGSDDDSDAAASSSAAGSSGSASAGAEASSSSSDEDVQAFCTQAEAAFAQVSGPLDAAGADATDVPAALEAAVSALGAIDPPAEIADDWATSQQAFVGLRDVVDSVDLSTAEGQAAVEQAVTDLSTQAGDAQTNIDAWITANCDNA
jgi:hypothetical protein